MISRRKFNLYQAAEHASRYRYHRHYANEIIGVQLEHLGTRLTRIREVINTANSDWARNHWTQVEAQLARKIATLTQEIQ